MPAKLQIWAWVIFLLFTTNQLAKCEIFYIIPSTDSPCPGKLTGEPCFTLSQYINGEYRQYTSDPSEIVLQFQPGHHTADLSRDTRTFASQLVSFTMTSESENSSEIYCSNSHYQINHIHNVHISGINFVSCSYQIESVTNFIQEDSSFSHAQYYALYIGNSSATIKGCTFTNNQNGALEFDNSSVELRDTTFVGNGGTSGGALTVYDTQSRVTVNHCNFVANSAARGGAIFTSSSITIQNSTFTNNGVGDKSNACEGGAIHVNGSSISLAIQQSWFKNNQVSGENGAGGAIYVTGINNSLFISQSEFMNNEIDQVGNGGAVCLTGDNSRIVIEQSLFSNNGALTGSGGAIYTSGLNIYISVTESVVSNNSATKCGALDVDDFQHHNLIFKDSIFKSNSAIIKSGGVLCIRNASISIQNVTFSHNRAAENAGVFVVDDSEVTIQRSAFDDNTARANGGVINTEYFRNSLLISHTSFTNNQATEQGGVLYLGRKGSQVKISRSTIGSNNATRGGFAAILGSSLEIASTNIFSNSAETGEVISACNSDISVSDQLNTTTDPEYPVCTLYSGDINGTDLEVTTTTSTVLNTTTTADIPTTTSERPTPEPMSIAKPTTSQPSKPSITTSMYFELNGKAYLNNSVISLSEVGENENALLCKTDLVTCCATLPNQFQKFYYPNGDTVLVKKAGYGFYHDTGIQEVRLNRREGVTSPTGKFCCALPDASENIQNLCIHLLSEAINFAVANEQK